eukprot:357832-Chlamydomonas_euryale.AAC.15
MHHHALELVDVVVARAAARRLRHGSHLRWAALQRLQTVSGVAEHVERDRKLKPLLDLHVHMREGAQPQSQAGAQACLRSHHTLDCEPPQLAHSSLPGRSRLQAGVHRHPGSPCTAVTHLVPLRVEVVVLKALEVDHQRLRQPLDAHALECRHAAADFLAEVGVLPLHQLTLHSARHTRSRRPEPACLRRLEGSKGRPQPAPWDVERSKQTPPASSPAQAGRSCMGLAYLHVGFQALLQTALALDVHADLVEVLLQLAAVVDVLADDLLRKAAAHHILHGWRLPGAAQVGVHAVLQPREELVRVLVFLDVHGHAVVVLEAAPKVSWVVAACPAKAQVSKQHLQLVKHAVRLLSRLDERCAEHELADARLHEELLQHGVHVTRGAAIAQPDVLIWLAQIVHHLDVLPAAHSLWRAACSIGGNLTVLRAKRQAISMRCMHAMSQVCEVAGNHRSMGCSYFVMVIGPCWK